MQSACKVHVWATEPGPWNLTSPYFFIHYKLTEKCFLSETFPANILAVPPSASNSAHTKFWMKRWNKMALHRNLREKSHHHSFCSLPLIWAVGGSKDGAVMLQHSLSFPCFNLSAVLLHLALDQALTYVTDSFGSFWDLSKAAKRQMKDRGGREVE